MPFKQGKSGNPTTQFSSENQPKMNGRPKGSSNRSTLVRVLLDMPSEFPERNYEQLKKLFPDIEKRMTVEEVGSIMQLARMVGKGDTNAYKALMDSTYGKPKRSIVLTEDSSGSIPNELDYSKLSDEQLLNIIAGNYSSVDG